MEKFDIYMSIGNTCRPAYYLCIHGLRTKAYPLDWQKQYSLNTVIHLFETEFEDFFTDITEEKSIPGCRNRRIIDIKNNITSIHHFPKNLELKKAQNAFISKMRKRFERLGGELKTNRRLFLLGNRKECMEELEGFLVAFSKLYPNLQIKLVNVRDDKRLSSKELSSEELHIRENLSILDYTINDTLDFETGEKFDWRGNISQWGGF